MRALALGSDAIVFVSRIWQTTCTAVRAGDEGFVIDSPVFPDELEALPSVLEQASFPVSGLLATHADWDHLLGPPGVPRGIAGMRRVDRRAPDLGPRRRPARAAAVRRGELRRGPRAALAGGLPGAAGTREARDRSRPGARDAPGRGPHRPTAPRSWRPWLGVLVCGDYLSPVEIPMISQGGSLTAYRATLERLRELVGRAQTVVPGHGAPVAPGRALEILEQDAGLPGRAGARGRAGAAARGPAHGRPAGDPRAQRRAGVRYSDARADHGERVAGGDRRADGDRQLGRPCPPCAR